MRKAKTQSVVTFFFQYSTKTVHHCIVYTVHQKISIDAKMGWSGWYMKRLCGLRLWCKFEPPGKHLEFIFAYPHHSLGTRSLLIVKNEPASSHNEICLRYCVSHTFILWGILSGNNNGAMAHGMRLLIPKRNYLSNFFGFDQMIHFEASFWFQGWTI